MHDDGIEIDMEDNAVQMMDELLKVSAMPNQDLMKEYQIPIDHMENLSFNSEDMRKVSSDEEESDEKVEEEI
jgi:hypothetical protein